MKKKKKIYYIPKSIIKRFYVDKSNYWKHPGGKLLHAGPENLSDTELLSILIATGVKGKSAERIAEEIMERFGSFKGLANQPLDKLETLKGLGPVKTIRIAAAFEIARRIVRETKRNS